jgi:phosphoglycolate phosphatase
MLWHFGKAELPSELIATYVGDGAPMLVRRALGDPEDEKFVQEALNFFLAYYREHKLDNTRVYDGIVEALASIRQSGNGQPRTLAVLSNKPVNPSRAIVEGLGLAGFFAHVYGGNSFPTKKPDPLGAQKLLEETGSHPHQTAIVGDSSNDVLTGRNAGLWTVGVTYGFAPHSLALTSPDVLVDTPGELAEVFR